MSKQQYSLAFIFDSTLESVLLVKKNRPDFQKGRFNGLGGKVEEGETFVQAAKREVQEESGIDIIPEAFLYVGKDESPYFEMEVYAAISENFLDYQTCTDEVVYSISVDGLKNQTSIDLMDNVYHYIITGASEIRKEAAFLKTKKECMRLRNKINKSTVNKNTNLAIKILNYALMESRDWEPEETQKWIGFVQGLLFSEGLIDVEIDKNYLAIIDKKG